MFPQIWIGVADKLPPWVAPCQGVKQVVGLLFRHTTRSGIIQKSIRIAPRGTAAARNDGGAAYPSPAGPQTQPALLRKAHLHVTTGRILNRFQLAVAGMTGRHVLATE
jgi:hypothetical protein